MVILLSESACDITPLAVLRDLVNQMSVSVMITAQISGYRVHIDL